MDPLSITASILAILQVTASLVNFANDVKDAPKDRARFAMEASSLSSLLLNLRYQIEDGQSDEAWYKEVALLALPDGPLDQYKHALEKLQLKIASGKGLAKIGDALLWKFSKEEVANILLRIERLKSLIQIALQMDHFKLSQAIKTSLNEIYGNSEDLKLDMVVVRSQIPAIQDSVDAVQRDQERQKNQALLEWISSTNYSSQLSDFIAKKVPGTGQWFLDSSEFNNWLAGPSCTLFCPGIPGAGKTMISAIVIDHLHKMAYSDRCEVAHIFCNYKTQSEQNTTSLLSAILKQLVQAKPSAAKAANILYQRHSDRGTRPSLDDIFATLKTTMKSFSIVYVVIDALDECTDQDRTRIEFLEKLRALQQEFDVRLMVTSRIIADIMSQFESSPTLEIQASPADVKRYVRGQMHRLPRCVQRDEKLQEEVEDKIDKAVDGMFLLARLHIESLQDKRTKARVQSILDALPTGAEALEKAYGDAIKRIEAQLADDSKLAKSILSWITYAERPLSTNELCHALAVNLGDSDLNEDNILEVDDIVSVCAGLVTVDEESNIVRLVHYTTQEYFLQIREAWNPTAQQEITVTCLTYLSFDPFKGGSCDEDDVFEERMTYYAFLDYASRYWGHHTQTVQEQASELALAFLRDSKLISCALQAALVFTHKYPGCSQTFEKLVTGVHLAARFGLQYLLARLLSGPSAASSMLVNSQDDHGRTPLFQAVEGGHEAVVKLLLERKDVEVHTMAEYSQTPISQAAVGGHEAIAKLLLEQEGVEADTQDEDGYTPLFKAANSGHEAVMKLFLDQKDVRADRKGQLLCFAAHKGLVAIVKLLLERQDVEADTKDKYSYQTPLSRAAEGGHEEIVKLLLERKDVEADSKDRNGRTPLSWAADKEHVAIVKLLLERKDVDAGTKDNDGRVLLSWAAQGGNGEIVKLLLERKDIEADAKDKDGRTPLSWVAGPSYGNRGDYEAIVNLLIEREDVEVDSKDNKGQTPLSIAADAGNEWLVKLLIERDDVEADSKDNEGFTPFTRAAWRGYVGIVKLLVEREDVMADSKTNNGSTPLMFAIGGRHEGIVRLLLGREDVDPAIKDVFGQTPLSLAARGGRTEVVKLLLKRNINADVKDHEGKTPLMYAAKKGNATIVKLLLERDDVDPSATNNAGDTALSWAAKKCRYGALEILRARLGQSGEGENEGGPSKIEE